MKRIALTLLASALAVGGLVAGAGSSSAADAASSAVDTIAP